MKFLSLEKLNQEVQKEIEKSSIQDVGEEFLNKDELNYYLALS